MVRSYTISQNNGAINPIGSNGTPVRNRRTARGHDYHARRQSHVHRKCRRNSHRRIPSTVMALWRPPVHRQTPVPCPSLWQRIRPENFCLWRIRAPPPIVTSGTISVFAISGTSLTLGSPFPTELPADISGSGPSGLAVSPVGSYLYVANQFSNNVQSYSYDASGNLTLIRTYTAGTNPTGLAFSRCARVLPQTPRRLFAPSAMTIIFLSLTQVRTIISIFSACIQVSASCVAPDGTWREIPSKSPVAAGVGPATILINRTSDFVYAVDRGSSQVSEYQYSPATGVLTPLATGSGGASVFSGSITSNIANNASTFNWVVFTNNGSSNLSTFQVAVTGKLIAPTYRPVCCAGPALRNFAEMRFPACDLHQHWRHETHAAICYRRIDEYAGSIANPHVRRRRSLIPNKSPRSPMPMSSRARKGLSLERLYMTRQIGGTAWSPDGKTIVFVSNITGRNNLWLVPADGGWPTQLTVSDQRQSNPTWSPNGKWIAYQSDYDGDEQWDIFLVSPKTGQIVNVTKTREISEENPVWSPDGRYLAYIVKPKTSSVFEIDVFDTLLRDVKHITSNTPADKLNTNPIWSKDGKLIAYTQEDAKGTDSNIFVADVKTAKSILVTPHEGEKLYVANDFSSDGKALLITSNAANGFRKRGSPRSRHKKD